MNVLDPVKVLRTLVVKVLGVDQGHVRVRIFRDPDGHIRVCAPDLPDVTRQTLEIAVPMHRDEVGTATAVAGAEKVFQPCETGGCTGDGGRAELHPVFLQGFDFSDPRLRGQVGRDAAAAVALPIRLVEGEDVRDVRPPVHLRRDIVEEGIVGCIGWGSPEHGDKFKLRGVVIRR